MVPTGLVPASLIATWYPTGALDVAPLGDKLPSVSVTPGRMNVQFTFLNHVHDVVG